MIRAMIHCATAGFLLQKPLRGLHGISALIGSAACGMLWVVYLKG